jgi:hypothetical protein
MTYTTEEKRTIAELLHESKNDMPVDERAIWPRANDAMKKKRQQETTNTTYTTEIKNTANRVLALYSMLEDNINHGSLTGIAIWADALITYLAHIEDDNRRLLKKEINFVVNNNTEKKYTAERLRMLIYLLDASIAERDYIASNMWYEKIVECMIRLEYDNNLMR